MTVDDSVKLAEAEIKEVFDKGDSVPVVRGVDTGKYGQIVGKCPVCGKSVVRGKFNYGCIGFDEGCKFRMGINICRRDIPIMEVVRLLETGSTGFMNGFISKNGKRFDARFIIKDGNAVFDFEKK
jgi:DNA topoisomerase-3